MKPQPQRRPNRTPNDRPARSIGPRSPRPHDAPRPPGRRPMLPHGVRLVHEDRDLIVVDKPPGLPTLLPGDSHSPSVVVAIMRWADDRRRPWIAHDLDEEASGLVVLAWTRETATAIRRAFSTRRATASYVAVVEGEIENENAPASPADHSADPASPDAPPPADRAPLGGTIQSLIQEDRYGRALTVPVGDAAASRARVDPPRRLRDTPPLAEDPAADRSSPRRAVTHWQLMASGNGHAMLRLRPITGRRRQLQAHLAQWGHPIAGDARSGAHADPIRRVALHLAEVRLDHPRTNEPVRLASRPPPRFYELVGRPAPARPTRPDEPASDRPAADTSWDHVAGWYDQLLTEGRSDHVDRIILPGVIRLLQPAPGQRILDVACGEGWLSRHLATLGVASVGIDAAPRLIDTARARAEALDPPPHFVVGDARRLDDADLGERPFDAVACVMALMNIDPLEPVLAGCAARLAPGGALVVVILHPAFRAPRRSSWEWTTEGGKVRQFRRVDAYLSPASVDITMNPGAVASGAPPVTTTTFHRPLGAYVHALARAGLLVDALEEWASDRVSEPGPRAGEENRARREIPLLAAIRARRAPPAP